MAEKAEALLKRPLYIFDLPHNLLDSLQLKDSTALHPRLFEEPTSPAPLLQLSEGEDGSKPSISCGLCGVAFQTPTDQRQHVKSDWHGFNLKQKLRSLPSVDEIQFDKLVGDLDESISGSESSDSEEDGKKDSTLSALLKRQAKLYDGSEVDDAPRPQAKGPGNTPLLWFSSSLLPTNTSLGIYKGMLSDVEQKDHNLLEVLRKKQLKPIAAHTNHSRNIAASGPTGPKVFMCMIGGGHFAAMILSLTPKVGKGPTGNEERQAIVIAHKTFHRYTTRRKQGGAQSANDSAKGAAHSAGASIRRHNEMALESEVRALLLDWKSMINEADLIFVRATGTVNRRTLFGPYDNQVLRNNDPRNRTFPFNTRRATQAELMRAFVQLTRVSVSRVDEAALAVAAAQAAKREELSKSSPISIKPAVSKLSKEEEAALFHTSQLQALIRRSKGPATLAYLSTNSLSPNFMFQPPATQANHHASTPLHLAASTNSPVIILALLTKADADPSVLNGEGKPAFDVAGDRATRDAFRVARSQLGEGKWNWESAHCPPPMTKAEADQREISERRESEKLEAERRKAETERLSKEAPATSNRGGKSASGYILGAPEMTGEERREWEARGLTPEARAKLERERRARAAEERFRQMASGSGGGR